MNRRLFLQNCTAAALGNSFSFCTSSKLQASPKNKPNIVLFYTDDLDFDEIEPYDIKKFPFRDFLNSVNPVPMEP